MEIRFPDIPLYKGWAIPIAWRPPFAAWNSWRAIYPRKSKEPCCAAGPIASIRRAMARTSSSTANAWCAPSVSRAGRWIT